MLSLKVIWPKSQHQDQNILVLSFSPFLLKFNFSQAQTAQGQTDSSVFMINDSDSKHTLELRYKNVTAKILMESFVIIIQSHIKEALLLQCCRLRTMRASVIKIWYCRERQLGRPETRVSWIIINILVFHGNWNASNVVQDSFHAWFALYGLA